MTVRDAAADMAGVRAEAGVVAAVMAAEVRVAEARVAGTRRMTAAVRARHADRAAEKTLIKPATIQRRTAKIG
jgi:hypothetical protein